jgi:hypothetical protein
MTFLRALIQHANVIMTLFVKLKHLHNLITLFPAIEELALTPDLLNFRDQAFIVYDYINSYLQTNENDEYRESMHQFDNNFFINSLIYCKKCLKSIADEAKYIYSHRVGLVVDTNLYHCYNCSLDKLIIKIYMLKNVLEKNFIETPQFSCVIMRPSIEDYKIDDNCY